MLNLSSSSVSALSTSRIGKRHPILLALFLAASALVSNAAENTTMEASAASNQMLPKPRLILQITVDALRGDLPKRYAHVLGDGGFRYLMEQGVDYINANYQHANTETIVGHVSLATGSVPAAHGMVGNVWFDFEKGHLTYNIEDADYHLLTAGADVDSTTEIDPTQKAATVDGRSPAAILSSTFSDELAAHFNGQSKIFAVSVKDRGAVSLAGHAGKAFWFSKSSGEFVTSTYYYQRYPEWVNEFNGGKPALAYAGKAWELMFPATDYLFGNDDDREYETDFPGFGRTFPHAYGQADDKYLTTRLTLSPAGDELTLAFAKALLDTSNWARTKCPITSRSAFRPTTTSAIYSALPVSRRKTTSPGSIAPWPNCWPTSTNRSAWITPWSYCPPTTASRKHRDICMNWASKMRTTPIPAPGTRSPPSKR